MSEAAKKAAAEMKLSLDEEKNLGFLIAMSKSNTEKITKEILEGLSEDTGDSESYDMDSGGEDSEDRPWRPSHSVYGKSTIKENHLVNMRGRYFRDLSVVRADEGEKTDRKSTRLNSSHMSISYAVFCLKKKIAEEQSRDS